MDATNNRSPPETSYNQNFSRLSGMSLESIIHADPLFLEDSGFGGSRARPYNSSLVDSYSPEVGRPECEIRQVWAHNLDEAFVCIVEIANEYPFIALDTEFPGPVARPTGAILDYNFSTIQCNVDLLQMVQLGLSFANKDGKMPSGAGTWQFNFRFDIENDVYSRDAYDFLQQSSVNFDLAREQGIEVESFATGLFKSGLLFRSDLQWIVFNGGYDLAFLVKNLNNAVPSSPSKFLEVVHECFPIVYDVRCMLRATPLLMDFSLKNICEQLGAERAVPEHHAGPDSLAILTIFFLVTAQYFSNPAKLHQFRGLIHGLTSESQTGAMETNSRPFTESSGRQFKPDFSQEHVHREGKAKQVHDQPDLLGDVSLSRKRIAQVNSESVAAPQSAPKEGNGSSRGHFNYKSDLPAGMLRIPPHLGTQLQGNSSSKALGSSSSRVTISRAKSFGAKTFTNTKPQSHPAET